MPNWTTNFIAAIPKNGVKFLNIQKEDLFTDGEFDFNKLIPMPEDLNIQIPCEVNEAYAVIYYLTDRCSTQPSELPEKKKAFLGKFFKKGAPDVLFQTLCAETSLQDSDSLYEAGRQFVSNLKNHGCPSWYEWKKEHWGVKANADYTAASEDTLSFVTPWCAPLPVFEALSAKYPDYYFDTVSEYEDGGSLYYRYEAGRIISEEYSDDNEDGED